MINEAVKKVVENSAFLSLVTVKADNAPHPIVVGKGEVKDGKVVLGIYKMETTQKNLAANPKAWLVAATMTDGPKGYRLSGSAAAKDKQVIFTVEKAEELI